MAEDAAHRGGDPSPSPPPTASSDRKGGPGHTVLLAVLVALPAIKVGYTIGGGEAAWEFFTTVGVDNWLEILADSLLHNAWFAAVTAVVVSRMIYAAGAARGSVAPGGGLRTVLLTIAVTAVNPLAFGVLMAVFFGTWWGVGTGLAAFLLRQGIVAEYRTGRRTAHPGGSAHAAPAPAEAAFWKRRAAAFEQAVAAALAIVVLPVLALGATLNGRSWGPMVACDVNTGQGVHRATMIEIDRKGNGVVGWLVRGGGVANGQNCGGVEDLRIRPAWWE